MLIDRFLSEARTKGVRAALQKALQYPSKLLKRRKYRSMLSAESDVQKFSEIYRHNLWGSDESASGTGSEVEYTLLLREWLVSNIPAMGVSKLVDVPCGDFNWMQLVLEQVEVDYTGIDIVPDLIEKNQRRFGKDGTRFISANACIEPIPDADLIIARDLLFHLSWKDTGKFLQNLSRTNYRYPLTTTHILPSHQENVDCQTGDFRLISLFKKPSGFNEARVSAHVLDCLPEDVPQREMILLEKADVSVSLNS